MNLKKPFGWKGLRVREYIHLARTNRPAATGAAVIGILAIAMVFAWREPSAPGDIKQSPRAAATGSAAESASQPDAAAAKPTVPVTITGCLERDDETFRLKDTEGTDAPKSRSWKTAFLKKRSASIEVVDAANRLKLTKYVGQRVSLTGVLVDREMHARMLQRVAASCASKPAKSDAL